MTLAFDPGELVTYGPLLVAIPITVAAGLVSFLSLCCLPLVPGYLAHVTGSAGAEAQRTVPAGHGGRTTTAVRSRTVVGTGLFILGFAAVFTSYGAAFGAVGATLLEHQVAVTRVLGVFTILLGMMFMGWLGKVPFVNGTVRPGYQPRSGWPAHRCSA